MPHYKIDIVVLFMFPTLIDNIYGIFVTVTVSGL